MKRMKMVPVLVGVLVCTALFFTTCAALQEQLDKWIADASKTGVYVGVFSYDGEEYTDLVDKQQRQDRESVVVSAASSSLAYLDADNNVQIQNAVLANYVQGDISARLLMYSLDKIIDKIKTSERKLKNDLDNVTIVSFSNGEDQGSPDKDKIATLEECGNSLKAKINTNTIKGKSINAYSVIVSANATPSDDVKRTAQWVTSGDASWGESPFIIRAPNLTLATLQPIFEKIATGLPGIQTSKSVTITINGPGSISTQYKDADNTNFCAVFNDKLPTDSDASYIKGFIQKNEDNIYEITAIKYKDVTGVPPSAVEASNQKGTRFEFNFAGVEGTFTSVKQYKYDGSAWVALSGAGTSTSEEVTVIPATPKTAIVVLVLDASLPSADITNVRSAAKAFINKLYEQSIK